MLVVGRGIVSSADPGSVHHSVGDVALHPPDDTHVETVPWTFLFLAPFPLYALLAWEQG